MERTLADYMGGRSPKAFRAEPKYFRDGDFVSYFLENSLYYAQRIDERVTIYISEDTGKMIGCKIKSISHLLKQLGDFSVEVESDDIALGLLFLTAATFAEISKRQRYLEVARKIGHASIGRSELRIAA